MILEDSTERSTKLTPYGSTKTSGCSSCGTGGRRSTSTTPKAGPDEAIEVIDEHMEEVRKEFDED